MRARKNSRNGRSCNRGFVCPKCGEITQIFRSGGGRRMAEDMGVRFLGAIPMDPNIAEACDNGQAFVRQYAASPTAVIMQEIIQPIIELSGKDSKEY